MTDEELNTLTASVAEKLKADSIDVEQLPTADDPSGSIIPIAKDGALRKVGYDDLTVASMTDDDIDDAISAAGATAAATASAQSASATPSAVEGTTVRTTKATIINIE